MYRITLYVLGISCLEKFYSIEREVRGFWRGDLFQEFIAKREVSH